MIRVRYFAAAAEAAGLDEEALPSGTFAEVRAAILARHDALQAVLPRCALLADGERPADDEHVADGVTLDVLPPFAGG